MATGRDPCLPPAHDLIERSARNGREDGKMRTLHCTLLESSKGADIVLRSSEPAPLSSLFWGFYQKIGDRKRVNPNVSVATDMPAMLKTTDPWMLFLYALKAPATKEKYIPRLTKFLDFLGYKGSKEEKARAFAAKAKSRPMLLL